MRLSCVAIALLAICSRAALPQPPIMTGGRYQQSTPSPPRRTLTGTVVNSVTGEPIRRALVGVNGQGTGVAFTTPDGRFEIPNIPEGQLLLTAQKPGFFAPGTSPVSGPPLTITFGAATPAIVLKMQPAAKIRGHILDNHSESIENLAVQLISQVIVEGRKQWQVRGQTTTDDTGAYALDELIAGHYVLRTLGLSSMSAGAVANGAPSEVFAPSFYPAAPDLSSAQAFELKPGQELPLDLTLSAVPGFRVSGVVTGGPLAAVVIQDEQGQPVSYGVGVDSRNGKFLLRGIPRGSWMLHAFSQQGQPENPPEATLPIQVAASDIQGLVLQLQPLPAIPVHVADSSAANQVVMVNLLPLTANAQNRRFDAYQGPGDPPGSLALHGVLPGTYRLSTHVNGDSVCLASAMSGSTDLLHDELTVAPGSQPPPIEITLRTDCASVSGTVHSSAAEPSAASVILLGDSGSPSVVNAGPDGKFSFRNLTPGAYRLFAFNDVSDLEYANPEALRDFTGQGITVGSSEKSTVQLDVITREK